MAVLLLSIRLPTFVCMFVYTLVPVSKQGCAAHASNDDGTVRNWKRNIRPNVSFAVQNTSMDGTFITIQYSICCCEV